MRRYPVKSCSQAFTIDLCMSASQWSGKEDWRAEGSQAVHWAKACGRRKKWDPRRNGGEGKQTPQPELHTVKENLTATN